MGNVRRFEVCIFLKEGLLDPQGRAVRIFMEDTPENREKLQELSGNFLANPVIETFELHLREGEG